MIDPDGVCRQKIYMFFAVETRHDANKIESYLNENNYTFIVADDVPFGVWLCSIDCRNLVCDDATTFFAF